jgi:hypothetical protein
MAWCLDKYRDFTILMYPSWQMEQVFTSPQRKWLTPWSIDHFEELIVAQLVKKLPPFTKAESLLPCSHEPAVWPYPEPDKSSPYFTPLSSILILSSQLQLGLLCSLFHAGR